jgi:hypothetical protein
MPGGRAEYAAPMELIFLFDCIYYNDFAPDGAKPYLRMRSAGRRPRRGGARATPDLKNTNPRSVARTGTVYENKVFALRWGVAPQTYAAFTHTEHCVLHRQRD